MQHHQLIIGRGSPCVGVTSNGACLTDDSSTIGEWCEVMQSITGASLVALEDLVAAARRFGLEHPEAAAALGVEVGDGILIMVVGSATAVIGAADGPNTVRCDHGEPSARLLGPGSTAALGVDLDDRSGVAALSTTTAPDGGLLIVSTALFDDHSDPTHRRRRDDAPTGPVLFGARCPLGHLNAPAWTLCRFCGESLGGAPLVDGVRPTLGTLTLSDGRSVDLRRSVVVGRRPTPASHDGRRECAVLSVPSPDKVISRTHFEVSVVDWDLRLIDRGSHNGTRLHRAHSRDLVLHEGQSVPLELGDVIMFADMTAVIGAPRSGAT